MDISQFCDQMIALYNSRKQYSNLKMKRLESRLSQSELSRLSEVPVRTIQQYEQRQKKINNAGAETIMKLARVLNCSASDLLELECWLSEYGIPDYRLLYYFSIKPTSLCYIGSFLWVQLYTFKKEPVEVSVEEVHEVIKGTSLSEWVLFSILPKKTSTEDLSSEQSFFDIILTRLLPSDNQTAYNGLRGNCKFGKLSIQP